MSHPREKQYGLINPKKNLVPTGPINRPSIFDEDSDSDGGPPKPIGISRELKRQEILAQKKAVEEDPMIYQYDEIYDDMEQKKKESKLSRKDLDRKPKYINKLLKAAEKRKLENERRIERQVQRDREAEGNLYNDKESFVTSAYKKKLEELKQQEELEKREEYLEAIGDVTKQGNLDGFYRHLYEQKVNYNEERNEKMDAIKTKLDSNVKVEEKDTETANDEKLSSKNTDNNTDADKNKEKSRKRQYRKRDDSKSQQSDSEDEVDKTQMHLNSNLDADSDFSIDSDSDEDVANGEPTKKAAKTDNSTEDKEAIEHKTEETTKSPSLLPSVEAPKVVKPKVDIWKKRTVGEVFVAAQQRYFERKRLRASG